MSKRRTLYPVRLEGVYITEEQQAFIERESHRRDPEAHRQRNGVVRDCVDFASDHYSLFLTWLANRGNVA